MLELEHETIVPLAKAGKHPLLQRGRRPGQPVHRSVLERWRTRGIRGIVLETALIGGTRVTTEQAIERFIERLNTPGADSDSITPRQNAKMHEQAKRELAAAGI
jgi:hypothetical protein